MSWPTVAECKAYSADVPEVKNAADSVIEGKIDDAKIFIKTHCKQEFDVSEEGVAKYFNGNDGDILDLYPRCYAVTAIVDNSYALTDLVNLKYGDNFSNLEAKYPIASLGLRYRRTRAITEGFDKMFSLGSNNIKVTGNWGWAAIPDDIINACKQIVERLVIKRLDIRSWTTPFQAERTPDGYSYNKVAGLPSILDYELASKLNKYIYDLVSITKL